MRAELPWNVAGIPPEAREAARAAARREGLSVGEWLTRRILRSFSSMEDEVVPHENQASLDSWGLPQSAASRRDSEEMLARVGRSENESNEAWRRIEEQLKGLGRRLDSSERSHSESNRVLSRTAQEMNISAREQAQAFEQLGQNIVGLNERLERLERSAANDGIRDAVKALHQGLSRLADQITATTTNNAGQLAQITTNLEKLAGHVGQIWEDADTADQLLERRIEVAEKEMDQRIQTTERVLVQRIEVAEKDTDQRIQNAERILGQRIQDTEQELDARLVAAENTAQFNTNTLDHAMEKIEAGAAQRAADQIESQRRAAQYEESFHRLEDSIVRLEKLLPDAHLGERLGGVEHSVSALTDRLEQYDPAEKIDASLQALSHRLEQLEKEHAGLVAELKAATQFPEQPPVQEPPEPPKSSEPPSSPGVFDAPTFTEPPQASGLSVHEPPPDAFPGESGTGEAFAPPFTPHTFTFDSPQDRREGAFTPDFDDVFAEPSEEPENFLAQARRSARAASEKTESERRSSLSAFHWSQHAAESEEKPKPRYLIPVLVAAIVMLAAAAALILSQRAKMPEPLPAAKPVSSTTKSPAPSDSNGPHFVVAPSPGGQTSDKANGQANGQTSSQANNLSPDQPDVGEAEDINAQHSKPAQSNVPAPLPQQQHGAAGTSAEPSPQTAAAEPGAKNGAAKDAASKANAPVSLDHIVQLANSGNPAALTVLGLRALDGTNGAAVNMADAVKFLTAAAEKGQAVAQYRLGTLYERGQGVTADAAKAMRWYEMAANQGNRKAMHNLAVAYAAGATGKKNMAEAARWFAKAAALGLSDSQFNLAVLYERGDGVPQSLVDAYKWYSIAAAAGDTESKARMGVLQTQLGDADKAAADKSAATFHAAPLNRSANVPPEPADLGT